MTKIIETDADKLLELIEQKRKITSRDAAKILDVKESQIRKWADILERSNMINLKLKLLTMELFSKRYEEQVKIS